MVRVEFDVTTGERVEIPLNAEEIAVLLANIEAAPRYIPQEVTRFQARAALYQQNLLQIVEDEISKPETDMMLKLAWQDAQTFKRGSSFVTGMASILNLTEEQIDDLFILAAGIE